MGFDIGKLALLSNPITMPLGIAEMVTPATTDLLRSLTNSGFDATKDISKGVMELGPAGYLLNPLAIFAPAVYQSASQAQQMLNGENNKVQKHDVPTQGTEEATDAEPQYYYPPGFQERYSQPGGFAGTQGNEVIATSLRDEVLGDGQENCFERAMKIATPLDSVLMLDDKTDTSGHAVVQHPDGTITDPNNPDKKYRSVAEYLKANPRYADPIGVRYGDLKMVLELPPGEARNRMIAELGLERVADRMVADPQSASGASATYAAGFTPTGNTTYDLANAIANAPTYSPTELALLSKIKDPEQRAIQELQMQMQKQALLCTVITNLANMRHEMLKAVAQNLRS